MLDLDEIINKTFEIKLGGKVIHIKQPTACIVQKITALENKDSSEVIKGEKDIVKDVLNNNSDDVKFDSDYIDTLPIAVLNSVMEEITKFVSEANNNPN